MTDIIVRNIFTPTANKDGKVTATAEKNTHVLNRLTDSAILGAALTGRGAVAKLARSHVAKNATTLAGLLAADSLDGSQWGDLLGLLVAEFGVGQFSRATMRGKNGTELYLASVRAATAARFDRAETVKQQNAALTLIDRIDTATVQVRRLIEEAESARMLADTGMTEGATEGATA